MARRFGGSNERIFCHGVIARWPFRGETLKQVEAINPERAITVCAKTFCPGARLFQARSMQIGQGDVGLERSRLFWKTEPAGSALAGAGEPGQIGIGRDSRPDGAWLAATKPSHPIDFQFQLPGLDLAELMVDFPCGVGVDVAEEAQRDVEILKRTPTGPCEVFLKVQERFCDVIGNGQGRENTVEHRALAPFRRWRLNPESSNSGRQQKAPPHCEGADLDALGESVQPASSPSLPKCSASK